MALTAQMIDADQAAVHLDRDALRGPRGKPEECPAGYFVDQVRQGKMDAVGFFFNGEHIASVALQGCKGQTGNEIVIHAMAGDLPDTQLLGEGLDLLQEQGEAQGFTQMRFHTFRKGLMQLATERGFYPSEIVMKKVF